MSMQRSEPRSAVTDRKAISRVAVVTHGRPERIGDAVGRLRAVAERCGVAVVDDDRPELAVVLGGDGTTLRGLHRFLGTGIPCLGVNFGRVGFLTSIEGDQLEEGLTRAFAGDLDVVSLPTLEAEDGGQQLIGINDVVLASGVLGRMAVVEWCVDGASLGELGCDGLILSTPTGSTAYNLSAGGPVLAWGTDAFAVSFVSPHSLHARSMVLGPAHRVEVYNRTPDIPLQIVVDGHTHGQVAPGGCVTVRLGDARAQLARLGGTSFFTRYRETFSK
jgi:NAD+ kinase